jgi:hypothetical protein
VTIDETFHQRRLGCYGLTRVHHLDGQVLRVRVCRGAYLFQSHAAVEVLTPHRTWTELATAPPTDWHPDRPLHAADGTAQAAVAGRLVERARRILDPRGRP